MGVKTDAFFAWNWHQNDNCSMLAWEQSSFFNCARKFAEWISSSFLDDMLLIVPFSVSRGEREYYCWCFTTTRFDLNLRVVREMCVRVFSEGAVMVRLRKILVFIIGIATCVLWP